MRILAATAKGIGKQASEDRILVHDRILEDTAYELETDAVRIAGICDGVGGQAGGALAADFLCRHAWEYLVENPQTGVRNLAAALLDYANGFVQERCMAAAMTLLLPEQHLIVHAGNTRAYRIVRGCLRKLTHDHTTREILLQQNRPDAAAAAPPTQLSGCMGGGSLRYSELAELITLPAGNLVLTSDGIHDTLSMEKLEELLFAGDDMLGNIQRIVQAAAEQGSLDDRSILVIQF